MRFVIPVFAFLIFYTVINFSIWNSAAIAIWIGYVINMVMNLNNTIAFREYILVMYGLNYLFSPALTYQVTQELSFYNMKIPESTYFSMAIPAMFCLHLGLFSIKTKIFKTRFTLDKVQEYLNQSLLKQWLIAGVLLSFTSSFFPGDLAFIVYLLSGIRFVGAFGLFILDRKKYKWYLLGILFIEISGALRVGMFHDMLIWILFFSLLWTYLKKPSTSTKFVLGVTAVLIFYILQVTKGTYREQLQSGGGGLGTFSSAVSKNSQKGSLFSLGNFANSLTRANQGWIFSSSVNLMDTRQNFQGMTIVKKYAEAAIMPRFLAPDKLEAGDKAIFNEFSGAKIAAYSNTSMGLGILADGYIAYGTYGVFLFAFVLGLICALVFKAIEKWSRLSPIFVLFCFPLLNFAVRADCETQTMMGHIVKGLVAFGGLIYFTKRHLEKKTIALSRSDSEEEIIEPSPQLISSTI